MVQNSRGGCFLREPKRRRQRDTAAKGLGGVEIVENDKIHKIHTPQLQECVFSEGAEAPQAARHSRKELWGPEIVKNDKIHNIHAPQFQWCVFSEVAEAPQAC